MTSVWSKAILINRIIDLARTISTDISDYTVNKKYFKELAELIAEWDKMYEQERINYSN